MGETQELENMPALQWTLLGMLMGTAIVEEKFTAADFQVIEFAPAEPLREALFSFVYELTMLKSVLASQVDLATRIQNKLIATAVTLGLPLVQLLVRTVEHE